MRVAIVGSFPLDSNRIEGGVQSAFAYLVNGLRQIDDLEIHILTFGGRSLKGADQLEQDGVTIHLLPLFPRFEMAKNFRTYQTVLNEKLAQIRPSVVHAQDATDHAYVALRSGYPTVVTVHGVRLRNLGDIDGLAGALRRLLENPSLRMAVGQASYRFANENYRASAVARRTYDVYQKIAGVGR